MSTPSPSLTEWTQTRFNALFEHPGTAESESEHNTTQSTPLAVENMLSNKAQIFLNHASVSIDEFKKQLGQTFGTNKTEVEWKECMEVPDKEDDNVKSGTGTTGIVAGYIIVTRTLKFRIRAAPAKNHTNISISAKIAHDSDLEAAQDSDSDRRRIVQLFYTSTTKAAPVHLPQRTHQ